MQYQDLAARGKLAEGEKGRKLIASLISVLLGSCSQGSGNAIVNENSNT